jgi:hypothetical protein
MLNLLEKIMESDPTAIRRRFEPLEFRTDPQTRLGGLVGRILVMKKKTHTFLLEGVQITLY